MLPFHLDLPHNTCQRNIAGLTYYLLCCFRPVIIVSPEGSELITRFHFLETC